MSQPTAGQEQTNSFLPKRLDWDRLQFASQSEIAELLTDETHIPTIHKLALVVPLVNVKLFGLIEAPGIQIRAVDRLSVGVWPGAPNELLESLRSYCLDEVIFRFLIAHREALTGPFLTFRLYWQDGSSTTVWRELTRSRLWQRMDWILRAEMISFLTSVVIDQAEKPKAKSKEIRPLIPSFAKLIERVREDAIDEFELFICLTEAALRIQEIRPDFIIRTIKSLKAREAGIGIAALERLYEIASEERNEVGMHMLSSYAPIHDEKEE